MATDWQYPIYRGNDAQVRSQIMEALQDLHNRLSSYYLEGWPLVKTEVELDEELTIPTGHQLLAYNSFTVTGTIQLEGELVIL